MKLIKIGRYYLNPDTVTHITAYARTVETVASCVVHVMGGGPDLQLQLPAEDVAYRLADSIYMEPQTP